MFRAHQPALSAARQEEGHRGAAPNAGPTSPGGWPQPVAAAKTRSLVQATVLTTVSACPLLGP
jgi:hypothetical protein